MLDVGAIREKMFASAGGACFVFFENETVLVERCPKKGAIFGSEWFLPGGKIDAGETAYAACLREAHEELGVRILEAVPLQVLNGAPKGGPYFPLYPFLVLKYDGLIPHRVQDEHRAELRWASVEEMLRSEQMQVRSMVAAALKYQRERSAALRATREVGGVAEIHYSDSADCACCPGYHVCGVWARLDYPDQPEHRRHVGAWLEDQLYALRPEIDGRRFRVTLEILPAREQEGPL